MEKYITQLDTWYKNRAGIYKLSIDKHIYIGSSISLYNRLKQHRTDLKNNRHSNQYLQRAVNKYGFDNLKYEVIILFHDIKLKTLRTFEKNYIEYFKADLNLKKDPVTENCCITTSKIVYQYNLVGDLIKKWPCCNEAARHLGVDSSGINVACVRPDRQHLCAGYLWSYEYPYPNNKFINPIYCFSLSGEFVGKYCSTAEIAETIFPDIQRKTVLSQLKKKIDSGIPYKNLYLSSSEEFHIDPNYKPKYKEQDELELMLANNPIVYIYSKKNILLDSKHLNDFEKPVYIKHKIRKHCNRYRLTLGENYFEKRKYSILAINKETGEEITFNSGVHAAEVLFNDRALSKNIYKHIVRNTIYKGYYFKRALYKTP